MTLQKGNLRKGTIYRIKSRNLHVAVYDGDNGLIGVRVKFGERYLFTEYLARECGGNPGCDTAYPEAPIGVVPDDVPLLTLLGTKCSGCGRCARWTGPPAPAPWECDGGCEKTHPAAIENKKLFDILDPLDKAITADQDSNGSQPE